MGGRRGRIKGRQKRAEEGVSREEGRSRVEEGEISNSIFFKIFLLAEVVWGEQGRKS